MLQARAWERHFDAAGQTPSSRTLGAAQRCHNFDPGVGHLDSPCPPALPGRRRFAPRCLEATPRGRPQWQKHAPGASSRASFTLPRGSCSLIVIVGSLELFLASFETFFSGGGRGQEVRRRGRQRIGTHPERGWRQGRTLAKRGWRRETWEGMNPLLAPAPQMGVSRMRRATPVVSPKFFSDVQPNGRGLSDRHGQGRKWKHHPDVGTPPPDVSSAAAGKPKYRASGA